MTVAYGAWMDCGDRAAGDRLITDLPGTVTFGNRPYALEHFEVRLDDVDYLHLIPAVPDKGDLTQGQLRDLMNQVGQALASVRGYLFTHLGQDVDGVLSYQDLIAHPEKIGEYPGRRPYVSEPV